MKKILVTMSILIISLLLFGCLLNNNTQTTQKQNKTIQQHNKTVETQQPVKTTPVQNPDEIKIIANLKTQEQYITMICNNDSITKQLSNKTFIICKSPTDTDCIKYTYKELCN